MEHWKKLNSSIYRDIPITQYLHEASGMLLYIASHDVPIVNSAIVFATEPQNSRGAPHALEHMVFLGSKNYPQKGALDKIANLCLAQGTNASTSDTTTSYTFSVVGQTSFESLFPVYLDHCLQPLLSDDGFNTEIKHTTGTGSPSGVVFNEMKSHAANPWSVLHVEEKKNMYPNSPFQHYSGGLPEELYADLTAEELREFHHKFYHTGNCAVVVTGKISDEKHLLEVVHKSVMDSTDSESRARGVAIRSDPAKSRPFHSSVDFAQLKGTIESKLGSNFDTEFLGTMVDNPTGFVDMTWHVPEHHGATSTKEACILLNAWANYLTANSTSPLRREITDCADSLAAEVMGNASVEFLGAMSMIFVYVDKTKVDELRERVARILKREIEGARAFVKAAEETTTPPTSTQNGDFDPAKWISCYEQQKRTFASGFERKPSRVLEKACINHFIRSPDLTSFEDFHYYVTKQWVSYEYDENDQINDFGVQLSENDRHLVLLKAACDVAERFVLSMKPVVVTCFASDALLAQSKEKDKKLIESNAAKGEEYLKECQEKLDGAMKRLAEPVSTEVLSGVPKPNFEQIKSILPKSHLLSTCSNLECDEEIFADDGLRKLIKQLPFAVHIAHDQRLKSDCMDAWFDFTDIQPETRYLVELYMDIAISSPVYRYVEDPNQKGCALQYMTEDSFQLWLSDVTNNFATGTGTGNSNFMCGSRDQLGYVRFTLGDGERSVEEGLDALFASVCGLGVVAKEFLNPESQASTAAKDFRTAVVGAINRLVADAEILNDPSAFTRMAHQSSIWRDPAETNVAACNVFRQKKLLGEFKTVFENDNESELQVEILNKIAKFCVDTALLFLSKRALQVFLTAADAGDIEERYLSRLHSISMVYRDILIDTSDGNVVETREISAPPTFASGYRLLRSCWDLKEPQLSMITMASSDSCHFSLSRHVGGIKFRDHVALSLAEMYFCALEGPFWVKIRGEGLAYGYQLLHYRDRGSLDFNVYDSTNPQACLETARQAVRDALAITIDDMDETDTSEEAKALRVEIASAKSSLVFTIVHSLSTPPLFNERVFGYLLGGHPVNDHDRFLDTLAELTWKDIRQVIETYIAPLLLVGDRVKSEKRRAMTCVVSPALVESQKTVLKRIAIEEDMEFLEYESVSEFKKSIVGTED